ncbi:MAG: hypothetical protein WED33_05045 [Bacteroidia bacterium]
MKTQRTNYRFISACKNSLVCAFIFSATTLTYAQTSVGSGLTGSAKLKEEKESPIVSFSPVFADGKTFVRWLVQNDEKDGLFIVERSSDGNDYEALGFKDRVGSPLCVNLFYSYVDEDPLNGQTYYRIMSVGTDQTFSYSDVVRVRTDVTAATPATNSASNNKEE